VVTAAGWVILYVVVMLLGMVAGSLMWQLSGLGADLRQRERDAERQALALAEREIAVRQREHMLRFANRHEAAL
jgi:type II secretory pathway pseudopilin PulG